MAVVAGLSLVTMRAEAAANGLSLQQAIAPNLIATGGRARIQYTLTNTNAFPLNDVSFTNALPSPLSVAFPKNLTNDFNSGAVTTGGNVITASGITLQPNQTGTIALDVSGSSVGIATNVISGVYSTETGAGGPVEAVVFVVGGPPSDATADNATNIQPTAATLKGTVRLHGVPSQVYFRFGLLEDVLDSKTPSLQVPFGTDALAVSIQATGLALATKYYYQLVATNEMGTAIGGVVGSRWFYSQGSGSGALAVNATNYLLTPELSVAMADETSTVEFWFKANTNWGRILGELGQASTGTGWDSTVFEVHPDLTNFVAVWANVAGVRYCGGVDAASWHHFAWRYDKAALRWSVLVDGLYKTTRAGDRSAPFESGYDLYYALGNGAAALVDEFRVWNVARTDADILANYNKRLTGSEPGLIAYWRLNEGAGSVARDSTGHGHTATFVNSPAWVPSGAPLQQLGGLLVRLENGIVRLSLSGAPGSVRTIQVSDDLNSWSNLGTAIAGADGVAEIDDTGAPGKSARFYRATAP